MPKMKNRFKLRLSSLLCPSFCTCRSGNLSDVIEKPVFVPEPQQRSIQPPPPSPPPSTPKPIPFRSICRPDCRESKRAVQNSFITCKEANILRKNRASASRDPESKTPLNFDSAGRSNQSRRSKTSRRRRRKAVYSKSRKKAEAYFAPDDVPSSVFYYKRAFQNSFITCKEASILRQSRASVSKDPESTTPLNFYPAGRSNQSRRSKTSRRRKAIYFKSKRKAEVYCAIDNAPSSVLYNNGWETGDDGEEDGTETLFSSGSATRSVSSDSSVEISLCREGPIVVDSWPGPLRGSAAVVKCSVDRYSDFRNSMVEMIVERQIFAVEDLEQLLLCFLSLNASQHHSTIVEVFVGICEALFSARD